MRYRLSLRSRLLVAFVVTGAVLGPLLTSALLWATYRLEEDAIAESATARLAQVMAQPEQFGLRALPQAAGVLVLSNFAAGRFPTQMLQLPDGVHEYETPDGDAWFVALGTTARGRYAVVEDISTLEKREGVAALVVAGGTAISMVLALWMGVYLSRRLLAPLVHLSERVGLGSEEHQPLAPDFTGDEVGKLAAALDRQAARMHETLRREREFSADVSHELRTPLTVIQNAAELIADDAASPERARRAAERIRVAAVNMTETVTVLLTLGREERAVGEDEHVSVAECVERLLRDRLLVAPGGPQVQWHAPARPELRAPQAIVEAIAANLIRNAQQHSLGQQVHVTLQSDRLIVQDDGIGIPPAQMPGAAALGTRGPPSATAGHGLGLSLVQRLCARFGWSLHIASKPGEGTCVEWRFA